MEHVVFFPAHDGTPAFRRVAGLDDAVRLVEHLRNVEGVSEVSCHTLSEVPLAFRAYYRVEVPEMEAAEPVALTEPVAATAVSVPEPSSPEPDAPQPAMASATGPASDGATSLGFFA